MNASYSELHSRLNHLVNYSSQLIFVSSESIAEQHRTLEAFMADQSEQTEVAFVTASHEEQVVSYRRQLCRQLIGQVAGSFVRPLNELLVSLNHHDGPVLIGITQAHHLPNSFLQELWDLVLQSRFAANKQHLNIVLFGDSGWAEEAQSWLPAKNTATPLLLSSESIEHVETELEQLISQKRAAFQQRLTERYENEDNQNNDIALIKKPWFSLVIIVFFSLFFAAILGWQYPEKMQSLLGLSSISSETRPKAPVQTSSLNTDDTLALQPVAQEVSIANGDNDEKLDVTQSSLTTEIIEAPLETSVTEELLVSQWQADDDALQNNSVEVQAESVRAEAVADQPALVESPSWPALPAVDDSRYLIQMAGLQDIDLALQYLTDQNLLDSVWLYKTRRYGGDWYVIVHHQVYDSLNDAQAGITDLPSYQSQSAPFIKSSEQINTELNQ